MADKILGEAIGILVLANLAVATVRSRWVPCQLDAAVSIKAHAALTTQPSLHIRVANGSARLVSALGQVVTTRALTHIPFSLSQQVEV